MIIDTPPLELDIIENAVLKADAILIPVRASIFDIGSITPVVEMCRERHKPYAFVLSAVDSRFKKLTERAMAALVSEGPICATRISYRQPYICAADGRQWPATRSRRTCAPRSIHSGARSSAWRWAHSQRLGGPRPMADVSDDWDMAAARAKFAAKVDTRKAARKDRQKRLNGAVDGRSLRATGRTEHLNFRRLAANRGSARQAHRQGQAIPVAGGSHHRQAARGRGAIRECVALSASSVSCAA